MKNKINALIESFGLDHIFIKDVLRRLTIEEDRCYKLIGVRSIYMTSRYEEVFEAWGAKYLELSFQTLVSESGGWEQYSSISKGTDVEYRLNSPHCRYLAEFLLKLFPQN